MARELSIHNCDAAILISELQFVIEYFLNLGHSHCELMFGWHWGIYYPPGNPWGTIQVPLADVETEVQKAVLASSGWVGGDDLQISFPSLDVGFIFCHHSGIHLTYTAEGQVSRDFLQRWSEAGLAPVECETVDKVAKEK